MLGASCFKHALDLRDAYLHGLELALPHDSSFAQHGNHGPRYEGLILHKGRLTGGHTLDELIPRALSLPQDGFGLENQRAGTSLLEIGHTS